MTKRYRGSKKSKSKQKHHHNKYEGPPSDLSVASVTDLAAWYEDHRNKEFVDDARARRGKTRRTYHYGTFIPQMNYHHTTKPDDMDAIVEEIFGSRYFCIGDQK